MPKTDYIYLIDLYVNSPFLNPDNDNKYWTLDEIARYLDGIEKGKPYSALGFIKDLARNHPEVFEIKHYEFKNKRIKMYRLNQEKLKRFIIKQKETQACIKFIGDKTTPRLFDNPLMIEPSDEWLAGNNEV